MLRCILVLSYVMNVLTLSNNIVASKPRNNPNPKPKLIKPTAIKFIKRGTAAGTAIGTTIPIITELTKLPSEINTIKTKMEPEENTQLPSSVIHRLKSNYDTWSYSKLFESMDSDNIASVSIHQDSKFLYVIDDKSYDITHTNIHYVTTIPAHMNELIDKLITHNIPFDIFN